MSPDRARLERALNSAGVAFDYEKDGEVWIRVPQNGLMLYSGVVDAMREAGYVFDRTRVRTGSGTHLVFAPSGGNGGWL